MTTTPRRERTERRSADAAGGEALRDHLLALLAQAFERRSWHGTNLRGSLRGLTAAEAAWRPAPDRHNVWELALHAAYWKYTVTRRLEDGRRGSFPLAGSNFFARPDDPRATPAALAARLRSDIALLGETHRRLLAAVEAFPAARFEAKAPGSPFRFRELVTGVAAHDLYHAGQIQLLKRLMPRRRSTPTRRTP